jgi:predicted TIM-barrel fold metal-dependent hydrolase
MFDTTAAALGLVYSGVLDACPELVVIHPHLGGTMPYVVDRVVECEINVSIERPLRDYLKRHFYVDTVSRTPGALGLASETYGASRVLYGTDYPWITRAGSRQYVDDNLDESWLRAVLHENRVDVLKLPGDASD